MRYISILDRATRKRLAFPQNAYGIGYKLSMNQVGSAQFTMPYDDPKTRFCQPLNYVEIYDGDEYIGLFRIVPSKIRRDPSTREITYECEHVIATLMDDVMVKWHEIGNLGVYTNQVIQYVLQHQTVQNWVLGDCEFAHQYLHGWEHENLLSALYSIPNVFTEAYRWDFETQRYPWTVHLRKNPTEETVQKSVFNRATGNTETFTVVRHNAVAEIRYRKNMIGIEKTVDASTLVTRLYPFGYGEGDNQLNISKVNPSGKLYIDADTQSQYGVISQVWIDRRYQYEDTLYQAALKRLNELKTPKVSYAIQAAIFEDLRKCKIGDIVRIIDDEDNTDLYLPLQTIRKDDIFGAPNDAELTFGNLQESIAGSIADLFDRQRIEESYSQGAVTLFSQSFQDNASEDYPAEMRFYLPDNVVHINQILLQGRLAAFRGYSKATKGGGATSSTTKDGGATTQTSAAGGGGSATSAAGGGGSATSASGGGGSASASGGASTTTSESTDCNPNQSTGESSVGGESASTDAANLHSHGYIRPTAGYSSRGTFGYGWHTHLFNISLKHSHSVKIPNHSHSVSIPAHTHSVSIPSHTHSVSIPTHSHSVSIPAHKHDFSIPEHSHNIEYGIYAGSRASSAVLMVDDTEVGSFSSFNNVDLIPYLRTDSSGLVTRGWHTIKVAPDSLSRIELDLVIQLFANSRGGGQY